MTPRFTQWPLLVLLSASGACTEASPDNAGSVAPTVTLGVVTGLRGTTEPCGCTSAPLGGLDRLATRIDALRAEGPFEWILVGDTFFDSADPVPHKLKAARLRAKTMVEIVERLRPAAIVLGPKDSSPVHKEFRDFVRRKKLPLFAPPGISATRGRPDSVMLTIGGVRVSLVGLSGDTTGQSALYTRGAVSARKAGGDVVIALTALSNNAAKLLSAKTRGFSALVSGGGIEIAEPSMTNGTLVVEAGDQGRYLGTLRLFPRWEHNATEAKRREWGFYDQGYPTRNQLTLRIERMEAAIAHMEEGPARGAREQKLVQLGAELAAFRTTPPPASHITWDVAPISRQTPAAAWATDTLSAFNASLCDITLRATSELPCASAPTPAEAYVGTAKCASCHPDDLAVYEKTKHAIAWQTLTKVGKECDLGCIGCHTVGYEQPGGYCRLRDAEANQNVGCESCHGPGAGHSGAPFSKTAGGPLFIAKPAAGTCAGCHNKEHSDRFEFATYLPKVLGPGHGEPLEP